MRSRRIKYHITALIIMAFILLFGIALLAQTKSAENSDKPVFTTICKIGVTKIDNADDSRYTGCREPNAVVTDKGTLVVVFGPHDQDAKNDRAHQDLICRTSQDNGSTWSPARRIMDYDMESLLPTSLIYDSETSKLILLVNVIFNAPERNDRLGVNTACEHYILFSDDEGESWSKPEPILEDEPGICVFGGGNGIQLQHGKHAGRLLVPGGVGPNGSVQGVFYSDDHGRSWQFANNGRIGNTEATACELPDGTILFHWREQKSQFGIQTCTSNDAGITIGEPSMALPDVWAGCNNSLLSVDFGEKHAVIFAGPLGSEDSRQTARSNGGAIISLDNGASWSGGLITPGWTFGYNTAVQLPDGEIGIIFEGIPPGVEELERDGWDKKELGIYLVKLSIKWLL
jgi:sialidase-1